MKSNAKSGRSSANCLNSARRCNAAGRLYFMQFRRTARSSPCDTGSRIEQSDDEDKGLQIVFVIRGGRCNLVGIINLHDQFECVDRHPSQRLDAEKVGHLVENDRDRNI